MMSIVNGCQFQFNCLAAGGSSNAVLALLARRRRRRWGDGRWRAVRNAAAAAAMLLLLLAAGWAAGARANAALTMLSIKRELNPMLCIFQTWLAAWRAIGNTNGCAPSPAGMIGDKCQVMVVAVCQPISR